MSSEIPTSFQYDKSSVREVYSETRSIVSSENPVDNVLSYFEQREQYGKPIPGKSTFRKRLEDLSSGKRVPVVLFNCISFTYAQDGQGIYPTAVPTATDTTSIVNFYKRDLDGLIKEVTKIGNPDVQVIVPDSEFDRRVLNIPLQDEELNERSIEIKDDLEDRLQGLPVTISLLSEFNERYGLPSPEAYTEQNYTRIKQTGGIKKKHVKAERLYFSRNNISDDFLEKISDEVIADRLMWYFGMYAGEGEAMRDSEAVVINLEDDGRVPTWLQRGASQNVKSSEGDVLPILTPVNTKEFVQYKKTVAELKKIDGNE